MADEDIRGWQASLIRRSNSGSSEAWVKLVSQSPKSPTLTRLPPLTPMEKPREPLAIPNAPSYPASNTSNESGSFDERKRTLTSEEGAAEPAAKDDDPWSVLKQQLTEAINPLVEAGEEEVDAHLFKEDMDKRLQEASW